MNEEKVRKHNAIEIDSDLYMLAWDRDCPRCSDVNDAHKPSKELSYDDLPLVTVTNMTTIQIKDLIEKLESMKEEVSMLPRFDGGANHWLIKGKLAVLNELIEYFKGKEK